MLVALHTQVHIKSEMKALKRAVQQWCGQDTPNAHKQ